MKIEYILLWSISFLAVYTGAAKVVNISHTSQGSPDFYLNHEVTFTCAAAGFSDIEVLTLAYNDHNTARSGCRYDGADKKWGPRAAPYIEVTNGLDSPPLIPEYCGSVGKSEGFSISIKVTITDAAVRGKFFCRAYDGTENIFSNLSVTPVKVAPTSLTMSSPILEDVVEGEEFEMKCESTGGDPVSSYRYEIKRGGAVVPTGSTYTPTVADTEGFTITCTDTAHPNWKGGNTMMTSKEVKPKYIEAKGQTDLTEDFNPDYTAPNHLRCTDHVTGNPPPHTFNWTQQGNRLEETSSTLNLLATAGVTEETVTCVASNGLGKDVTITWKIKWSSAVTTSTTTTAATTPSPPNVGAIVGGVFAAVAVIIIIVIVVVCYKKRSVPKAQVPQRPIDDPVIYADLVHDSQVPENDYMVLNTRDDNGEPAIPTSMAPAPPIYCNVEY